MAERTKPSAGLFLMMAFCVPMTALLAGVARGTIEAYGTFECMGVIADVPAGHVPADIGQVKVYINRSGIWKPVQDAVQVGSTNMFATSVFGLAPGTSYSFKVEFYDNSAGLITSQNVSGSTRAEVTIPTPTKTYYVSPSGNDGWAGTIGAPFKTVSHAFSVATAGTAIIMRGGTYYEGNIYPTVSGTSGAPIVLKAYTGETPVLDGADPLLVNTTWTSVQPQVYSHAFAIDCRAVTLRKKADGTIYRAYMMGSVAEVTSQSTWFDTRYYTFAELNIDAAFCADGVNVTIRVPSGVIGDYDVCVSKIDTGIYFEGRSFIYVDGVTFAHYGALEYNRGIYIDGSPDILIQHCRFLYNNLGILVKRQSDRDVIQDNTCVDDTADWHWTYTKGAGVGYSGQVEAGFISFGGTYSGRGIVMRRNDITGTFDGAEIGAYSYTGARTSETEFYDNTVRHVADDVLELDGYVRNVRVFRNYARESLSGLSLAQALEGPTWLVRNQIIDAGICKATEMEQFQGYPIKTNGGDGVDVGSGYVFLYHNTAYTTDPASNAFLIKHAIWKRFIFRNNIWCGKAGGFLDWEYTISPVDWDYDDLYMESGSFIQFGNRTDPSLNVYYNDLAEAFSGLGWLQHGISTVPQFTNAVSGDYSLQLASLCRNGGVVLPGVNEDYKGSAPDMGAVEYQDTPLYAFATADSETSTTNTNYVSKASLSMSPGVTDDWIIFGFCEFRCPNVNYAAYVQLFIDGVGEGQNTRKPVDPTDYLPFITVKVKNLTAGAHNVQLKYRAGNSSAAAYVRKARICAVRKGSLEFWNAAYDNAKALTINSTDIAVLTWTPATTGNYLVISTAELNATTAVSTDLQTLYNGVLNDEGIMRAADNGDYTTFMSFNYCANAPAGVPITHKITGRKMAADPINHYIRRARILALRLSGGRFAQTAAGYAFEQNTTQTTWQQCLTTTWMYGISGNWLFLNSARLNNSSTSYQTEVRVQLNNSADCGDQLMRPKATTDLLNFSSIDVRNLTTPRMVDMDWRTTNSAGTAKVKRLRFYGLPLDAQ